MGVEHYENFPVASLLCPRPLRPAIEAIYRFARTADDIADEGQSRPEDRLNQLAAYRADLAAVVAGRAASDRWLAVFPKLAQAIDNHRLPSPLLFALIDAFEQDVHNPVYPDRASLLDYCSRSANPIGRLLLHLYGVGDGRSLHRSDAICTALQLINFWQDLGVDQRRGRNYLPHDDARRFRVSISPGVPVVDSPQLRALLAELCEWSRELMLAGAPLALTVPGRTGWELRVVVQGGLRVLGRLTAAQYASMLVRPRLTAVDVPALLWGALRMGRSAAT